MQAPLKKSNTVPKIERAHPMTVANDVMPLRPLDLIDSDKTALADPEQLIWAQIVACIQNFDMSGAIAIVQDHLKKHPRNPAILNLIAALYIRQGQWAKAEKHLLPAARFAPQDFMIVNNLACAYIGRRAFADAERVLQKATSHSFINTAEFYYNLALAQAMQGKFNIAHETLKISLGLGSSPEADILLFEIVKTLGAHQQAEQILLQTLVKFPDSALVSYYLARLYGEKKKWREALDFAMRAVNTSPDNPYYGIAYTSFLSISTFSSYAPEHVSAICHVLGNQRVTISSIGSVWSEMFIKHPSWQTIFNKPDFPTFDEVRTFLDARKADKSLLDPYVIAGIRRIPIRNAAIERVFTMMRASYLDIITNTDTAIDQDDLTLISALAAQCFMNEYVYYVSPEETAQIAILRQRISQNSKDISGLLILACYASLDTLIDYQTGLALKDHPLLAKLVEEHIIETEQERALLKKIPTITPINDQISKLVEQMYMENPYPRWHNINYGGDPAYLKLASNIRDRRQVLIAGCGTGQHAAIVATNLENTQIMAIDLSKRSIAYAMRKTTEMGFNNIQYAQADLLELGILKQRFDHIECAGVLHHLADPIKGLDVLLSLLKPEGTLRLGLYSELARQSIVAGRNRVAAEGYTTTADSIRNFRHAIFSEPKDSPLAELLGRGDFYSLSNCRDLIFHVQEHRFTIPQLVEILESHGLDFGGFSLSGPALEKFSKRFPGNDALYNLQYWDQYEHENPSTFNGMYQFLAKKRP